MNHFPTISIIIPFYGKSFDLLLKCLDALYNQTYPASKIEILLIDNNESPVIEKKIKYNDRIKIIHERTPGSYAARNSGIDFAKGDVLAFTDSDCTPHSNWIQNGVEELLRFDSTYAIAGNIHFTFKLPVPNLFELYDSSLHLKQEFYVKKMGFATTANLIVPKSIISTCGKFDTNYFSGGDRELGERMKDNGFNLHFAKNAIVFHPARFSFFSIMRKNIRIVGGEFVRMKDKNRHNDSLLLKEITAYPVRLMMLLNGAKFRVKNRVNLIKVIMIFYMIQFARFLEAVRLLLGGKVRRT